MHRQPGARIPAGFHLAAGVDVAAHPVFGGEKSHKLHTGSAIEDVYGRVELGINPGRIGDQADPHTGKAGEAAVTENFDAGFDPGLRADGNQQRRRAKKVTKTVARQHSITIMKNPTYPTASCSQPAKKPGSIIERAMKAVHIA